MILDFQHCEFITSSDGRRFPKQRGPHLVLLGRSNVGKSSLINHLCRNKKMAKVSNTPGKTRCINFFHIDEKLLLVDLPGYGYAKRGHEERAKWEEMVRSYLEAFQEKIIFLQLIDARVGVTPIDQEVADWAEAIGKKVTRVLTKTDKVPKIKTDLLCYTIKEAGCREILIRKIHALIGEDGTA
ncbi:MAG: YihA family ribosome biogenesis GTP-binding protein [Verrucomicrobia bacterium]|jgi:GTP-binding protein|nr:YihA family ribosome biogenesis GTP-binding protein [Verrucomicrobiota bacterium]